MEDLHPSDDPGLIYSDSHGTFFAKKNFFHSSEFGTSDSLARTLHREPEVLGVLIPPGCTTASPPGDQHVLSPRDLHRAISEDFNLLASPSLILAIGMKRNWLI